MGLSLLTLLAPGWSFSQGSQYFTLSDVKARPLAMGGAFTSVEDDLASIQYNPAALDLYQADKSKRVTLFLNPVGLVVGGVRNKDIFNTGSYSLDDFLLTMGLLVKSVFVSLNAFDFGILLGEEGFFQPEAFANDDLFDVSGLQQNHAHSIVGRWKLADKISIGGSASLLYGSDENDPAKSRRDVAVSYGILLKPDKGLNVGVSFINLPDTLKDYRWPLERLVDESVNVGVSYKPFASMLLSLDVRNLGEEQNKAVREIHFGVEQVLFSHLALRAGFFDKKEEGEYSLTWGVGLLDRNLFSNPDNGFAHRDYFLNYAFVLEKNVGDYTRWHFLSLLIRI
ncbi:MAG: hypothetical protein ACE5HO_02330 [bacterium]